MCVFGRKRGKERGKDCLIGTAQRWVLAKGNTQWANKWTHVCFFFSNTGTALLHFYFIFHFLLSRWIIGHVGHILREQLPQNLSRKLKSLQGLLKSGDGNELHIKTAAFLAPLSHSHDCDVQSAVLQLCRTLGSHTGPTFSAWLWHIFAYEPHYKHIKPNALLLFKVHQDRPEGSIFSKQALSCFNLLASHVKTMFFWAKDLRECDSLNYLLYKRDE